jgi:hypothetical protein
MSQQNIRRVRQEFGPWRLWVIRAVRMHAVLCQSLASAVWPLADLLLRLSIARGFLASGVHRMMAAPGGTMLMHPERVLGW